jgi:hypothetical protein
MTADGPARLEHLRDLPVLKEKDPSGIFASCYPIGGNTYTGLFAAESTQTARNRARDPRSTEVTWIDGPRERLCDLLTVIRRNGVRRDAFAWTGHACLRQVSTTNKQSSECNPDYRPLAHGTSSLGRPYFTSRQANSRPLAPIGRISLSGAENTRHSLQLCKKIIDKCEAASRRRPRGDTTLRVA